MSGYEPYHFSLWWVFPLAMMLLCLFIMLGRKRGRGCCFHSSTAGRIHRKEQASVKEILDMRFASGGIDRAEYEAKKEIIFGPGTPQKADKGENDAGLP